MMPIQSFSPMAYAAGERCVARSKYALDIGGVRSRETAAVVRQVLRNSSHSQQAGYLVFLTRDELRAIRPDLDRLFSDEERHGIHQS